jgi:hypothetical protein
MDFLSAAILSGLIYDGVKEGAAISFDMLKSKLKGWIIGDAKIEEMIEKLKEAGVNEDLAPHAIERKISEHQSLLDLIQQVRISGDEACVTQTSVIGNNINSSGSGQVTVGSIDIKNGAV